MNDTLYVTDLDGTLFTSDARLTERTAEIVNRLIGQGMRFTYATARSLHSAAPLTAPLHLTLPVITYSGAFLCDPVSGEAMERCIPDRLRLQPLLKCLLESRAPVLAYSMIDGAERVSWMEGRENSAIRDYLDARVGDVRLRPVRDEARLFDGDVFYLSVIGAPALHDRLIALSRQADMSHTLQRDTYGARDWWLEVRRADADKASAIGKLKSQFGFARVVSFGDNLNDLPMFEVSDECCAVKNAHEDVKRAATHVICSNNEDGVARWLMEHVGRSLSSR